MLRRLASRATSGDTAPVEELSTFSPDPIFVISYRRQRSPEVIVEEGIGQEGQQNPAARNGVGGIQTEHPPYPRPVYLKTHFDIMYYLGMSPMKGDGQWGSQLQTVAFAIITGLAILNSLVTVKQYIVDLVEKGNLVDYIAVWKHATISAYIIYYLKLVTWDRHSVSRILDESTRIQPGILYKFPTPKISKIAVVLVCLRIIMAIAEAARPDWWLDGISLEDIILIRSLRVGNYVFLWSNHNSTSLTDELYDKFGDILSGTTVLMGITGFVLEFLLSLYVNVLPDMLLMTALHTHRISQIFQSNMHDILGNLRPNAGPLPMLREKHNLFYGMVKAVDDRFGELFMLLHVSNYIFSSYFLLDALEGRNKNVFLPAAIVTIPMITCTYIFAAKAVKRTQAVHNFIRDKDSDNDDSDDAESNKVTRFLEKLKSYPIGIGSDNFLVDATFTQRFVGLVISTFLLFVDRSEKQP